MHALTYFADGRGARRIDDAFLLNGDSAPPAREKCLVKLRGDAKIRIPLHLSCHDPPRAVRTPRFRRIFPTRAFSRIRSNARVHRALRASAATDKYAQLEIQNARNELVIIALSRNPLARLIRSSHVRLHIAITYVSLLGSRA